MSVLAAAIATAPPALAHDTWLLPNRGAVPSGTTVTLDLTSGMAFPANETAIKPERVARQAVRLAGVTSNLEQPRPVARSLQFKVRLGQPGIATLWVELAPKSIDLTPDQVKEYLEEIGASDAVRRARAGMPEPRRWREIYTKHAKTYVLVGQPTGDRSWAEPVGMGLEIAPEKDPTALRPGEEIPVRILSQGKPLPNFPVGLVRQGDAHGVLKTTDGQGRVTLPIDRAGRWLLRSTYLRRAAKPEADWESDFTTLTLEVR